MSKSRKDDHLRFASLSQEGINPLDKYELIKASDSHYSIADINLETQILGTTFPYPFYINAMTGGNEKGNQVNLFLAQIAAAFSLPFFVGSQSLALKDPQIAAKYEQLRSAFPSLFIVANVNPNTSVDDAQRAIKMLKANALAVHYNPIQELVMSEGDRDFSHWDQNIEAIIKSIKLPVIIKEVGYGMDKLTIQKFYNMGAKYIDISGKGGTNFTKIELARLGLTSSPYLAQGVFTDESIKNAQGFDGLTITASGGVNSAERIIKALCLGAHNIGMAYYFLNLTALDFKAAKQEIERLILDIKTILVSLNVKNISELSNKHIASK